MNRFHRFSGHTLVLCTVLAAFSSVPPAHAADASAVSPIVVFNLTKGSSTANRAFAIPTPDNTLLADLNKQATFDDTALKSLIDKLQAASLSTRWITKKNDRVTIYAIYDLNNYTEPSLEVKEDKRSTQLEQDLSTLAKIVAKEAGVSLAALPTPAYQIVSKDYTLTRPLASLTVTDTTQSKSADATISASVTISTGPSEHFFLAVDLPVSKGSQVKFDSTSHAFVNTDTPSFFLASLSYMIGDVLSEPQAAAQETPERTKKALADIGRRIVVKGLFKISSQPLDAAGIGLGLRLPPVTAYGFQLDTFSPWIGYVWIKEDKPVNSGVGSRYAGHLQGGLSFNLDKALSWIK